MNINNKNDDNLVLVNRNDRCLICYKLLITWKGNKLCNYYDLNSIIKIDNRWTQILDLINIELQTSKQQSFKTKHNNNKTQLSQITIRDLINITLNIDKPKFSDSYTKICENCFKTLLFIQYFSQSISEFRENICKKYVRSLQIIGKFKNFNKRKQKKSFLTNGSSCQTNSQQTHRTLNGLLSHSQQTNQVVSQNRRKRKSIRPHHLKEVLVNEDDLELHNYDEIEDNIDYEQPLDDAQTKRKKFKSCSYAESPGPLNLSTSREEADDFDGKPYENSQHSTSSSLISNPLHSQHAQLTNLSTKIKLQKHFKASRKSKTVISTDSLVSHQEEQTLLEVTSDHLTTAGQTSVSPTTSTSLQMDDNDRDVQNQSNNNGLSLKYTCEICDKSFKTQNILRQHLRIHTGDKPFKCSICSKCFSQMASLKYHLATHSDDRPFKCDYCTKSFKLKPPYKKHIKECRSKYELSGQNDAEDSDFNE